MLCIMAGMAGNGTNGTLPAKKIRPLNLQIQSESESIIIG